MPLSHTCTDGATENSDHLDQILSDLGTESRRLAERAPAEEDFERFEGELHELFAAAERALLAHELEQLDVDRPAVTIAGQRHHRVLRSTATYTSAVGPVSVLRTLYRTGCEPAVVPLELRAGIIEGHWTPRAAHQASYLVAHLTPQEAADTLRELGNMSPSKSSLDRLPKLLSSRWEEHRAEFEEVLRAEQSVPCAATTVAVSLDGVMAPMKDGARQAKRACEGGTVEYVACGADAGSQEGNPERDAERGSERGAGAAPRPEVGQAGRRGTRQLELSG